LFCLPSRILNNIIAVRLLKSNIVMAAGGTSNSMLRTWFLVVGIWLLYLFRQQALWFSPQHDALVSGGGISGWKSPLLHLDSDFDPSRLIFLISMGEQAKESKMVERFVWSARHRGQWNGYILLLTDAPIERYARLSQRFVVMNPQDKHFDKRFKDDMPYKRFKTRIIDYTNRDKRLDKVQLIYYLDVDNIVGNSLPDMFDDLESKYNIPNTENTNAGKWLATIPRVWFFVNKYKDKSVQGGQFIVDRKTSGRCLKAWRDKIDANITEAKDQPALHKIRGNGRNQECQIITMMSKSHIVFPTNKTIHRAVREIKNGVVQTYPALVHIKNSCNKTAQIDTRAEETYVQDIVRNAEYSKKIHVHPD